MPNRVMWATDVQGIFRYALRNFSRGCIRDAREIRGENSEMRETQRVCGQIFDEIILRVLQIKI